MKLLEIAINKTLFLENFKFKNELNNIELLNSKAQIADKLLEKLEWLNLATSKIEKFHSFFHFEQSFFHLVYAKELSQNNLIKESLEQLDCAIFQDHDNQEAIALKNNSFSAQSYQRRFTNYAEYLNFATGEDCSRDATHYHWQEYQHIKAMIEDLKARHAIYHQESAKLYLNRAMVFKQLNHEALALNDLNKAKNLDSQIFQRNYFQEIIPYLANKIILGLGSNLGEREHFLNQAREQLKNNKILFNPIYSNIVETEAILKPNSSASWNKKYLNQVVLGYSFLSPYNLLKEIKKIEYIIGRRDHEIWAPREIDIDILFFAEQIIDSEELKIPHPETLNRPWIINLLDHIYPKWKELYEQN
jgi:2-amino-4-hydroxy-6-hydroxymethyldihydropteridine diphosphokinase